jgi:hypothetical protein
LTPEERKILTLAFENGDSMELIAAEMNVLPMNVVRLLESGVRRYVLYLNKISRMERRYWTSKRGEY